MATSCKWYFQGFTVSRHANDTSKASHHQPVDHTDADTPNGNQDNNGTNEEIEHGSNNNNKDEDEDTEVNAPKQQWPHTFNNDIHPSQLCFYSGTWVNVLIISKNNYRLFIHIDDPFPERMAASLEDACICLLDAIGKFKEESRLPLNEGNLIQL